MAEVYQHSIRMANTLRVVEPVPNLLQMGNEFHPFDGGAACESAPQKIDFLPTGTRLLASVYFRRMTPTRFTMKTVLALFLAFSVYGVSLGCVSICAAEVEAAEPTDAQEVTASPEECDDDCCVLDTLQSRLPERLRKAPESFAIDFYFAAFRTDSIIACGPPGGFSQTAAIAFIPLQQNPTLRI